MDQQTPKKSADSHIKGACPPGVVHCQCSFITVPPEIYLKIVGLLDTAKDVSSLSKTCQRFQELNDRDGWRVFVQRKFTSLLLDLPTGTLNSLVGWQELAYCLVAQSRAWDRRSLSKRITVSLFWGNRQLRKVGYRHVEQGGPAQLSSQDQRALQKWDGVSGTLSLFRMRDQIEAGGEPSYTLPFIHLRHQTVDFHPMIDSTLEFAGKLSSKKQIVAWSTGPGFVVWVLRSGSFIPELADDSPDHYPVFDNSGHKIVQHLVQHDEFRAGLDDVVTINLVESSSQIRVSSSNGLVVDLIVGRASGYLHRYSVSNGQPFHAVMNTFRSFEQKGGDPARRSVRSADVTKRTEGQLLVACSDKVLSIYKVASEAHDVWPVVESKIQVEGRRSSAWTVKFLSDENLVVGLGQSLEPIQTYQITPSDVALTGRFGLDRDDNLDYEIDETSSVYAIEPVSAASRAGGSHNGNVFLAGWYDGVCRLYDLRTARTPVQSFYDSVEADAPIYSLCTFGQERFLAGSSNSVVRMFDFRNGAKVYYHTDGLPCSPRPPKPKPSFGIQKIDNVDTKDYLDDSVDNMACTYDSPPKNVDNSRFCNPRCHWNPYTGVPQTCHFHKLSRLDLYRPNANFYIYGTHSRGAEHKSPIFALSSPSPICPLIYAGTSGMVHEIEISEVDQQNRRTDPFFAPPLYQNFGRLPDGLVMYEVDDGRFPAKETLPTPKLLYSRGSDAPAGRPLAQYPNEQRLDKRWEYMS